MVKRLRRREIISSIGAAGVLGLAGCTGDGDDGGSDGGDGGSDGDDGGSDGGDGDDGGSSDGGDGSSGGRSIKMGLLMGVTGDLQDLGPPIRNAAQLVPQQVNDADTDFSVDTQFEDTATSPNQGVQNGNALVNAGYPMICGALSSEVSLQAAQQVAIPNSVTMCSPASTAPDFTTLEDNDLFFRTPPTDALQGAVLAQVAAERLGHDTASTLHLNNAYGNGLAQGFVDSFENEYNGTVTASVSFTKGQSSYTSQLQQALGDDPGVMLVVGYPDSGNQIFRDFYSNYDSSQDVLVSDGLQSGDLPGNVGQDMSNVRGTAPLGEGPGVDFFNQQYQDTYDSDPAGKPFTRQAYDAAAVLVLANAAAGENDGAAVSENMRTVAQGDGTEITPSNLVEGIEMADNGEAINYQGVSGPVAFDEAGDLGSATYDYFQFTDSGLESIESITP